jgi:parallel beta-helix repeat protein
MQRRFYALLLLVALSSGAARAGMPGDVDGNCQVDVADVVLYERWLQGGAPMLDPELLGNADVAPFDSDPGTAPAITPDGMNDAADLVVLQRAVGGDVTLPLAPAAPMLGSAPGTITNPLSLGFSVALANGVAATIEFKVNGHVQPDLLAVTGDADGTYEGSHNLLALYDGANTITATAIVNGKRSCASSSIGVTYTNGDSETIPTVINTNRVLTPGVAGGWYEISGLTTVEKNKHLIIQPGTVVKFDAGATLAVRSGGILRVQGESGSGEVTFTSAGSQTDGAWGGIEIRVSDLDPTKAIIDYASIRYATTGVTVRTIISPDDPCCLEGTVVEIKNSEITNFSARAVDIQKHALGTIDNVTITSPSGTTAVGFTDTTHSATHPTIIRNSTITGGHTGLAIVRAGPEARANTIQGQSNRSIWIDDVSNPVVEENQLIGNGCDRISLTGVNDDVPQPTIRLNRILAPAPASGSCAHMRIVVPPGTPPIRAESNYWATANPEDVLHDLIEKSAGTIVLTRPILDNALNPIGSEIVESEEISGTLTAGATYMIDGPTTVPVSETLTIPAGTRIEFNAESGANLLVEGTLQVAGTETLPVVFTSSRNEVGASPNPSPNDWSGLSVVAEALIDVDGAEFRYTDTAVSISNASNTNELNRRIRNSSAGSSVGTFASLTNVASALIEDNEIDLSGNIAIDLTNSSPRIVGNTIVDTTTAIRVTGAQSHPVIGPGNVIEDFVSSGITMTGTGANAVIDGNSIELTGTPQRAQGIVLTDAATPTITDNTISNTYFGIHVFGDSDPEITGGNVITGNVWGILLRGNRLVTNPAPPPFHNPDPVIEGNHFANGCTGSCQSPLEPDLCPTAGGNLCIFGYEYDAPVVVDVRENYWDNGSGASEAVAGPIRTKIFSELQNLVAVDFSNYLDAAPPIGVPVSFAAFTSIVTPFAISKDVLRPTFDTDDFVTISFSLLSDVDSLNVKLIEDVNLGATVRTIVVPTPVAGVHNVNWDGKDDGGLFVRDFAYRVRITATKGGHDYVHELFREVGGSHAFAELTASATTPWNGHRNQYSKAMVRNLRVNRPAMWALVQWEDDDASIVRRALAPNQERLMVFDGRSSTGLLLPDPGAPTNQVEVGYHGTPAVRKAIFVQDTAPVVFGVREGDVATVPTISNVEVLSDPYLANPIYDQVSTIQFKLDQPGDVSVKILKPGAPDDSDPADVVADLDVTGSALLKSATWHGYDESVSDADEVLQATQPGSYTFLIEARPEGQPSPKSTYRGTIQVRLAPGMGM